MTTTFEHKIIRFDLGWRGFDYAEMEGELGKLGSAGWEAVAAIQPSVGSAPTDVVFLLKRARPE